VSLRFALFNRTRSTRLEAASRQKATQSLVYLVSGRGTTFEAAKLWAFRFFKRATCSFE